MLRKNTARKVLLAAAFIAVLTMSFAPIRAQVLSPRAEDLRFQMLSNEPIAAPDRRSVVAGTSAMVVKDQRTGRCYVALTVGQATTMAPGDC